MKYLAGAGAVVVALWPWTVPAAPTWEQWQSVPGVFDLGGARADGSLIVAGSAALYTLTPAGDLEPFARGPGGYRDDPGAEAYIAASPSLHAGAANCDFTRDDVFVLRQHTPVGVTRVDASGEDSGSFTNVTGVASLSGITFDTAGAFDHRLLVTAPLNGKTELVAIDCKGSVQVITKTAPTVEGGLAVAPESFGDFAGSLIAADELTGVIWAIAPGGSARQVAASGLPVGQDVGVESVAFVPEGFTTRGGYLYYADHKTSGGAHPGTDHVLRLSGADLVAAGVQDGDLLAATEGGASLIAVRCTTSCHVTTVIATPTSAHGEGHLVFSLKAQPSPTPQPSAVATQVATAQTASTVPALVVALAAVIAAIAMVLVALALRRRR